MVAHLEKERIGYLINAIELSMVKFRSKLMDRSLRNFMLLASHTSETSSKMTPAIAAGRFLCRLRYALASLAVTIGKKSFLD